MNDRLSASVAMVVISAVCLSVCLSVWTESTDEDRALLGLLNMHDLKMQDWKMTDHVN